MKLFIDSADVKAVEAAVKTGLVDGVTTNPSLIAKSGGVHAEVISAICQMVSGPVSAEVTATDAQGMISEGRALSQIADNVVVKVPLTWAGLEACRALREDGTMVNVTLCFSATQALMAAKAGATFISPFIGRHDDLGFEGMDLIREIRQIYDNYPRLDTEILVASVRHTLHVRDAALSGADAATLPPQIFHGLLSHPLTEKGLEAFLADWEKSRHLAQKRS